MHRVLPSERGWSSKAHLLINIREQIEPVKPPVPNLANPGENCHPRRRTIAMQDRPKANYQRVMCFAIGPVMECPKGDFRHGVRQMKSVQIAAGVEMRLEMLQE
jgi:hypothetical protein